MVNTNFRDDTVTVFSGRGDGTLGPARFVATGGAPRSIAVADLDGDGRGEVITAGTLGVVGTVSVLRSADAGVQPGTDYRTVPEATGLAVGDLDGDSRRDVAVLDPSGGDVLVLLNRPGATLGPVTRFPLGAQAMGTENGQRMVITDLDRDGRADLAGVGRDGVYVARNTTR